MAKISGKDLKVTFGSTNLSDTIRNFSVTEQNETADATAGADSYRNFVNTVKMIEASAEIVMKGYSNGGSALRAAITPGASGTLIWGVEGTAAGKPKKGFLARISKADEAIPYADVVVLSVTWQMAGTALAFNGITDKY